MSKRIEYFNISTNATEPKTGATPLRPIFRRALTFCFWLITSSHGYGLAHFLRIEGS
jgi:hypothetical protein